MGSTLKRDCNLLCSLEQKTLVEMSMLRTRQNCHYKRPFCLVPGLLKNSCINDAGWPF